MRSREHGCHGEAGEGVAGAYPALAGSRAVTIRLSKSNGGTTNEGHAGATRSDTSSATPE